MKQEDLTNRNNAANSEADTEIAANNDRVDMIPQALQSLQQLDAIVGEFPVQLPTSIIQNLNTASKANHKVSKIVGIGIDVASIGCGSSMFGRTILVELLFWFFFLRYSA